MRRGFLSSYFSGIGIKRLSAVEVNPSASNQHEFNGVAALRSIFGTHRQQNIPTRFIYLDDDDANVVSEDTHVTWYDAREKHPKRSEYRLYYRSSDVYEKADENDLLIIGKRPDAPLLIIIVHAGTAIEKKILWLFGISGDEVRNRFATYHIEEELDKQVTYPVRLVLEEIGVNAIEPDEVYLEQMLRRFKGGFPPTHVFSEFARSTLQNVSAADDPDAALVAWMEQEEKLFRALERHLVGTRIRQGFEDVDTFIRFSLSVHNRRKSRAGLALENHIEQIFKEQGIRYSRGARTENKAKPDFLFPGIEFYRDPHFPNASLTMLGVKSTCKDRWRQVLSEAERIREKHLLTLEPGISKAQTKEMQAHHLQLVVPSPIHSTYEADQRAWLYSVADFLALVRERQSKI